VTATLVGKVAVVTGASRGIGKQTCLALANLGASLVLASRTEEPRERTPGTLNETADAVRS
jgi:NAD(P)-dependent dehydrogenase (short-subunit alcohol dehydrogenase family)